MPLPLEHVVRKARKIFSDAYQVPLRLLVFSEIVVRQGLQDIIASRGRDVVCPLPLPQFLLHVCGRVSFLHGLYPARLHGLGKPHREGQMIPVGELEAFLGAVLDDGHVRSLDLEVPHEGAVGKTGVVQVAAVLPALDRLEAVIYDLPRVAAGVHVAPYDPVHPPGGAEGIGIFRGKVAGQVFVLEGLFELLLLSELKAHDAERVDHGLVHAAREAVLGGLCSGEIKLGHEAGHVKVRDKLTVKGKLDLALSIVRKGHVQDRIPHVDAPGGDFGHQIRSPFVGLFRAFGNGLVEIGEPPVGGFDRLDEVSDGGQRGRLFSQAFGLVQVRLRVLQELGQELFRFGVVAAHELGLRHLLEDAERALVMARGPAVFRQKLAAQVEVLVGRLRSERVKGLVAGMIVELRKRVGRAGVRVLVPAEVQV